MGAPSSRIIVPEMAPIIAIDGPAASGKGTLARRLAAHYGLPWMDTGLLYRAVAMGVLARGAALDDEPAAVAVAQALPADFADDPALRTGDAGAAASRVAALPGVRAALLDAQRAFAATPGGAVLDGRDIGTVICPEAPAKLFVTASAEARADRRYRELAARDPATSYDRILADIRKRDADDAARTVAPLVPAEDAILLDTTRLGVEEAFAAARAIVEQRLGRAE
ncbi:(d)CMP kinase [Camelimonas sp. ID_303_24]